VQSIIPLNARGARKWNALGDCELIRYASWKLASEGITGRTELAKTDGGLYGTLQRRKLLGELGLEDKRGEVRDWASFSDKELTRFAMRFIAEKGILGRTELAKADSGLYQALNVRTLLDTLELEKKHRDWASMSDEGLVSFARRFITEKGISGRAEFADADSGLYFSLLRRKLLDELGLEKKLRNWASNEELIAYSLRFIEEGGIRGRKELEKADLGLYFALWRRSLLGAVFMLIDPEK
jgi:hypothetical protein